MSSTNKALITRNIKFSAVARIATMLVNFIILPYIVAKAGEEPFGIYVLVITFSGYMLTTMDFGVSSALTKFIAEYIGEDDRDKIKRIVNASFSFYVIIGLISAIILFGLSFSFHDLFNVSPANVTVSRQLLWVAAGASLFVWPGRTFDGILQGIQRYDWRAIIEIAAALLIAGSAYLIFALGGNIVHYLLAYYLVMVFRYICSFIIGNVRILKIRISFPYFDKETFKKMFSFSVFIFLASLFGIIYFHVDNLVIGAFISISAVTIYAVAYMIMEAFRTVNSLIGAPLVPAASLMEGLKNFAEQRILLLKGTKYMALIFGPMVVITVIFAPDLINAWMGTGFEDSYYPAQILVSFWLFNGITEVGSGLLTAKGYVKYKFVVSAINAAVNLTLSLILVQYIGLAGVALGTAIGMILVQAPLITRKFLKVTDISFWEYFNKAIKRSLLIYLCAAGLSYLILSFTDLQSLVLILVAMGIVYILSVILGFFISLSAGERHELVSLVKLL